MPKSLKFSRRTSTEDFKKAYREHPNGAIEPIAVVTFAIQSGSRNANDALRELCLELMSKKQMLPTTLAMWQMWFNSPLGDNYRKRMKRIDGYPNPYDLTTNSVASLTHPQYPA